jgi:hypothetical protein
MNSSKKETMLCNLPYNPDKGPPQYTKAEKAKLKESIRITVLVVW